jgi:hypothetical protein
MVGRAFRIMVWKIWAGRALVKRLWVRGLEFECDKRGVIGKFYGLRFIIKNRGNLSGLSQFIQNVK